jgi:gas vesicle protein
MSDRDSKFNSGLVIGAILGVIAAIFLTPKTGKEMQEEAKKKFKILKEKLESGEMEKRVLAIFGDTNIESKKIYMETREDVINTYNKLKEINYDKYVGLVNDAVDKISKKFKESKEISDDTMEKLKEDLMKEAEDLKDEKKKHIN